MRTTLEIDDDVLASAKAIARREGKTAGQVLSKLARQALARADMPTSGSRTTRGSRSRTGFRPFASRGTLVTNERIHALRDASET